MRSGNRCLGSRQVNPLLGHWTIPSPRVGKTNLWLGFIKFATCHQPGVWRGDAGGGRLGGGGERGGGEEPEGGAAGRLLPLPDHTDYYWRLPVMETDFLFWNLLGFMLDILIIGFFNPSQTEERLASPLTWFIHDKIGLEGGQENFAKIFLCHKIWLEKYFAEKYCHLIHPW